jgi:hypothetical protein
LKFLKRQDSLVELSGRFRTFDALMAGFADVLMEPPFRTFKFMAAGVAGTSTGRQSLNVLLALMCN